MISYIKILGPPVGKALVELEKVAVDIPKVCIMDRHFSPEIPSSLAREFGESRSVSYQGLQRNMDLNWIGSYYNRIGVEITGERCESIISKSDTQLGEYDFFFEWYEKPNLKQMTEFIEKIDEALAPLGCYYTITTKKK
jgi:hypothetical protein